MECNAPFRNKAIRTKLSTASRLIIFTAYLILRACDSLIQSERLAYERGMSNTQLRRRQRCEQYTL